LAHSYLCAWHAPTDTVCKPGPPDWPPTLGTTHRKMMTPTGTVTFTDGHGSERDFAGRWASCAEHVCAGSRRSLPRCQLRRRCQSLAQSIDGSVSDHTDSQHEFWPRFEHQSFALQRDGDIHRFHNTAVQRQRDRHGDVLRCCPREHTGNCSGQWQQGDTHSQHTASRDWRSYASIAATRTLQKAPRMYRIRS
jgi:hypothetical protein